MRERIGKYLSWFAVGSLIVYSSVKGLYPQQLNAFVERVIGHSTVLAFPMYYRVIGGVIFITIGVGGCWAGLKGKEGDFRSGENGEGGPISVGKGKAIFLSFGVLLVIAGLLVLTGAIQME